MSMITPLLDTLLHEVLGRRMDPLAPRQIPEPVTPSTPSEAPLAVRSDSRLHEQRPSLPLADVRVGAGSAAPSTPADEALPVHAGTQARFSPAARAIADVLNRFPAQQSVLRASAPLLSAGEAPAPVTLASRLQASIRDSGLFYESQQARWFRGELPISQLRHQPQMRLSGLASPVSTGVTAAQAVAIANASAMSPSVSPRPVALPVWSPSSLSAQLADPAGQWSLATPYASSPVVLRSGVGDSSQAKALDIIEPLQGLVRHQLELLAAPVIRWEGDVWSGLFMALVLHLPTAALGQHGEKGQKEHDEAQDGAEPRPSDDWHCTLALDVQGLGAIRVELGMRQRQLSLDLRADSTALLNRLQGGQDSLQQSLRRCGFEQVLLTLAVAQEPRHD